MNQWYIAGGDSGYYWAEQIRSFSWLPQVYRIEMGFGWFRLQTLWFDYPFRLLVKLLSLLGLSWWWIEKILWIGILILGVFASYKLATYVTKHKWTGILSSIIYTTNTYALLLFGGGQLGVALAYALSPYIIYRFLSCIDRITVDKEVSSIKYQVSSIKNGLWFALLVCCDLRLAYLVMGAIILYLVLSITYQVSNKNLSIPNTLYLILYTIIVPLFVAVLVHLFWILPMIMAGGGASLGGEEYTNAGMLKFLSVADFSHAVSLLHPNWPENLFGKVYFLQPEFLVLPILAFGSLLFFNVFKQKYASERGIKYQVSSIKYGKEYIIPNTSYVILFFAFLSLLGAFFAKGVNPPFGGVYEWFFSYVPGFVMFRDPTKFYLYVALGYSILIPYTLEQIGIKYSFIPNTLYRILYTVFIVFWCFTVRSLFFGQLSGNFKPLFLDKEFVQLKNLLIDDKESSRTLWIPETDAFIFFSDTHPFFSSDTLFNNASVSAVMDIMDKPAFQETLRNAGVKYVIVPIDQEKRIFLSDYKWDPKQREDLIASLSATALISHPEFQKMAVFENQDFIFHQEEKEKEPQYIEKQEAWSRTGLVISVIVLAFLLGVVVR